MPSTQPVTGTKALATTSSSRVSNNLATISDLTEMLADTRVNHRQDSEMEGLAEAVQGKWTPDSTHKKESIINQAGTGNMK